MKQRAWYRVPQNDAGGDGVGHVRVSILAIFTDGFESGDTSGWSGSVGEP